MYVESCVNIRCTVPSIPDLALLIFPLSARFMIKPQALIMPEVLDDDEDENANTSFTYTDAQDGDVSIDSMGMHALSPNSGMFFKGRTKKKSTF